jgi:hypothetical protein
VCLRGVSSLEKEWLEKQDAKDIAVFVVWSDQLGAEPRHVPDAAELIPDPRARHYWDGREVAGRAFQTLDYEGKPITLGAPAWDVWMLFDRNAEWVGVSAPKPVWWEHQVHTAPKERFLDPTRFAEKARALHGGEKLGDAHGAGGVRR